jgi:cell division protein FtsW
MLDFSRENTSDIAKWWRNVDRQILFVFIFLFLLGLFFSFASTSSVVGEKLNKETYFFFIKHFIFTSVSLFVIIFISIQKKNKVIKLVTPLFVISIIFLILVPLIGIEVKGSKRWIQFMFFPRFQPIELVKPLFILFTAKLIILNIKTNIYNRYLYSFFSLFIVVVFLINQPDLGQSLLLIFSWLIMIFVSGFSMYFFIFMGLIVISILFSIIYFFPSKFGYILYRIQTFLDPKSGDNFQAQKALDAIKQGGLTGQGMGEGILKDKVPEAHTDYIIAVISEEFGAFFVLFIIIIFLFLTHRITNKILIEKNEFLKLSLIGLISLLITQVFIHIGVNVRLLPTTGMTLPFLSYGGSSLLGIAITSGIILNFTRKDFLRDLHNE